MIVSAIVAVSENGIIGRKGDLPWRLPDDMKFFQRTTMGHHVITGRKNWDSIPLKYRPLKGRPNIVVTRNADFDAPGAVVVGSLNEAIALARHEGDVEAFIIGGGEIYKEALREGLVDRLYITRVHAHIDGDTSFPSIPTNEWKEVWREEHAADAQHGHAFTFQRLERLP
ncbi:MAG: dihydrofolate reductase [Flavobacteriales bacterium]|nr:MAG: dihydrofolate reductase [Flavobacteriales bacterium]